MKPDTDVPNTTDVEVTISGRWSGEEGYARDMIQSIIRRTRRPVLHAHVRLSKHTDPAVVCPVVAQANLDVNGRLLRAQVQRMTTRSAIDALAERLERQLDRLDRLRDKSQVPSDRPHHWRHNSTPTQRPRYFPRPIDQRRVVRRKSFSAMPCSVDEAVDEMELLDYDFHFFTEEGTQQASVLYRTKTGYRLAQVCPTSGQDLAPFRRTVSLSRQPAARITLQKAKERLGLIGLPFLFFIEMAEGRAFVLYCRYDGHYGLISPAG